MLFAYLGPETMMPLASIVGVVVGMVLMFWRKLLLFVREAFRRVWPSAKDPVSNSVANLETDSSTLNTKN
jgi:hypothetical protein